MPESCDDAFRKYYTPFFTGLEVNPAKNKQDLIATLVLRWEQLREQGDSHPNIDELCNGHPELASEVKKEVGRLAQIDLQLNLALDEPTMAPKQCDVGKSIGPYKLLQKIGEGGMGTVWMADQRRPVRRRVALKLVKRSMADAQLIARFEAERQALAMMDHQNIAKILDAGTADDGSPYFVMELVEGIPITEFADRNRLSTRERLELFVSVCHAVQHAHQKGILHRDLKPTNVLTQYCDGKPSVKVIDFGLAKAIQHETKLTDQTMFTAYGQVIGTLRYMSPEQATMDALNVDTRTDIYSLGVMLYELLTGSTPIDEDTLKSHAILNVIEMICNMEPPSPSQQLSTPSKRIQEISELRKIHPPQLLQILRGDLDWVVLKALEKDRARRYDSAGSFADEIQRYLDGEPVSARPPSRIYRLTKFAARNRKLVVALVAIAVLLIVGIASTSWLAYSSELARKEAEAERNRADQETLKADTARGEAVRAERQLRKVLSVYQVRSSFDALQRGDSVEAVRRLNEVRDREDFASQYLRQACERHVSKSQEQSYQLEFIAGHLIASVGPNGNLCICNVDGSVQEIGLPEDLFATCLAISPNGREAVVGCANGHILVFEPVARTMRLRSQISDALVGPGEPARSIRSVDYSPRGHEIVVGDDRGTVSICTVDNERVSVRLESETDSLTALKWSDNGRFIASGHEDGSVRVWDPTDLQVLQTLGPKPQSVSAIAFSPDSTVLAATDGTADLLLWEFEKMHEGRASQQQEFVPSLSHEGGAISVAFSPDGQVVATGGFDLVVKLWDVATGSLIDTFSGHRQAVHALAFSPDGQYVASGSAPVRLRPSFQIPNMYGGSAANTIIVSSFEQHANDALFNVRSERIAALKFSADGKRLVCVSSDPWNVSVRESTFCTEISRFSSPEFDAERAASARWSTLVKSLSLSSEYGLPSPAPPRAAVSALDEVTAIHHESDEILVIDAGKKQVKEIKAEIGFPGEAELAFSNDDRHLIATSSDGEIITIDTESERRTHSRLAIAPPFEIVSFSPDLTICAVAKQESLHLVRPSTGERLATLVGHTGHTSTFAFSQNSRLLASTGDNRAVYVWDLATNSLTASLETNGAIVTALTFSPACDLLVGGDRAGCLIFWDTATWQKLFTIHKHSFPIVVLTFSNDGEQLAIGDESSVVRVMRLPNK